MDDLMAAIGRQLDRLPIEALLALLTVTVPAALVALARKYGLRFMPVEGPANAQMAADLAAIRANAMRIPAMEKQICEQQKEIASMGRKLARIEGQLSPRPWLEERTLPPQSGG